MATSDNEETSRENTTLPIDMKFKNRIQDIGKSLASGRSRSHATLPTLHELGKNLSSETEIHTNGGRELHDETVFSQQVVSPPGINPMKPSALANLRDRARTISHNILPHVNNYRRTRYNIFETSHPTVNEIGSAIDLHTPDIERDFDIKLPEKSDQHKVKFGWIQGVLIRNMMSIWCVILFLRVSWVVGQAGVGQALIIIAISTFITLVTALSMSAIATNGEIGGGGTYFVMSRVLGPQFGGSIGIIFTIANAMDCALNVVGFAQTVIDMMMEYGGIRITDGGDNDVRIVGTVTLLFVCLICGLGTQYETKIKNVMLVIMLVSLSNFLAGSLMGPENEIEQARGFKGYSFDLFVENWGPAYTINEGHLQNFISVFSVYFPACIGILSGANVSGELKNPNQAIPKGTILAIIICSFGYAGIAIICGATMARGATGLVTDLQNGTYLDCVNNDCSYGLYHDYQAMSLISAFAPLNYVGCISVTLSSALAEFVSCPALIEALAADKLYPYWMIGFLGKGYGKSNVVYRAYTFTFLLAWAFVLIARLDSIAVLISDFFLATFALMNFSTFHISLVKPIGWRPTFKYYNTWLSLLTGISAIMAIILIDLPVAFITIAIVVFFYLVVLYRKPDVNWGSSTQAQTYRAALSTIQQLVQIEEHVKNYRPQILVLTGLPNHRPALVDFAYLICKNNSLMICGNILQEKLTSEMKAQLQQKAYRYLRFTNTKAFSSTADNSKLHAGVANMLDLAGVGKVKPNILMMGFKNDWATCDQRSLEDYVLAIGTGFEMDVGVAILRLREGLDCSEILADIDDLILKTKGGNSKSNQELKDSLKADSYSNVTLITSTASIALSTIEVTNEFETTISNANSATVLSGAKKNQSKISKKQALTYRDREGNELPKSILNQITLFQKKQKRDMVDVWWLSDDGGLTLLLPVIINSRSNWSETKLRVFCTASGVDELEKEHKGISMLLSKFRIDYSDLVIISDVNEPPKIKTKKWFDGIVNPLRRSRTNEPHITTEELEAFQSKTNRYLRLRELLHDHSSDSNLVVMTLPMPRIGTLSAPLYMAWLETLTANMPPFMLVRGNQTSVLTFYV